MFFYDQGIRLKGAELWLDATRRVPDACISHAHGDHIRRHAHVYATPATAGFLRLRIGKTRMTTVEFGAPVQAGAVEITFLPAGHILGSAQIRVVHNGVSLLYSGDFNMRRNGTSEAIEIQESDILIMESTFGHERFRFPPRETVVATLCEIVRTALNEGVVPVVYAYALGKAQEAMHALAANGFALCVHGSILRLAEVYTRFGHDFGDVSRFNANADLRGRVVILPPGARKHRHVARLNPVRSVFLSGWGMEKGAATRYGVDHILPMSDHADYDELLEYVQRVKPEQVYTTHGPHSYYRILRRHGFDAHPLVPEKQTDLFE